MQRRSFLKKAALGAGGAVVAAPVFAQDAPVLLWRLASSFPSQSSIIYAAAGDFARYVHQATDGRFSIDIVPVEQDVLSAVGDANVECGHTASCYYYDLDPSLCFDGAVPFGLNTRQMNAWMRQGGGLDLLRGRFRQHRIINFPCGYTGAQMGGWFRHEIKSVGDFNGLRLRASPFAAAVLARLGAQPQQIDGAQLRAALATGRIDAAKWIGPCEDEALGLHTSAPNYYFPGWWEGTLQTSLYVNLDAYEALPLNYQAVIAQASALAGQEMIARYDAANPAALRRLVGAGATLKAFLASVLQVCQAESAKLCNTLAAQDAAFSQLYDSMVAFRELTIPWLRLAEGSFDGAMSSRSSR
ncbi:TRAP transporter substrate-binding protein [Bordetella holmesii]|uniref:ABC transporter, substrate-binding protein, family 7 n=2 Tax=Bordetella holmesii TaxID=35814 RepID=A0A158M2R1_9BORD|nr:twin-arginine translocation signal domain-containing protein [Bordetella holmesii]AIT27844.1 tat (twin-arginine translocation) pathway signal sequence domain protein [Bordetella holmesii 44057]EWM40623.1 tat (twin-arginine translocation) pathway signal sequence domain protein [Bordetella holmesii 35009]EWM41623.1 tat (twin-arginine translocation) pathway signal sequence domain protein [Bordetella holmesii 41130]EWM44520.1 tat (twin-arginine translocation) pathway signal sequence domain prote